MGTNYFYCTETEKDCECCGQPTTVEEKLHIGKSSAGWAFLLRTHPDLDIQNLYDWIRKFLEPDSWVENEYGHFITTHEMLDKIMRRKNDPGERFSDSFLRTNGATYGHNNLLFPLSNSVEDAAGPTWVLEEREFS